MSESDVCLDDGQLQTVLDSLRFAANAGPVDLAADAAALFEVLRLVWLQRQVLDDLPLDDGMEGG